jgi:predicted PurR-regulated permease PerM
MSTNFRYILAGLGVILIGLSLWYFKSIVAYVLIAGVLSLIGQPLVDLICKVKIKKFQVPRVLSAAITLVILWTVLIMFFRIFIPLITEQAHELSQIESSSIVESLEEPISSIEKFVSGTNLPGQETFSIQDYISDKLVNVFNVSLITDFFGAITSTLGDLFIALFSITFISFFFLKEEGLFSLIIMTVTPTKHEERMKHFLKSVKKLLVRYFIGIMFEVILVMLFVSIGLTIVGLNFSTALVIGLFAGMINVIPYVGPIIGAMFGIIIGIASNIQLELYLELLPLVGYIAIVFLVVQVIDNIFFQPLIYSSSVNAHPLEIFLVISIAGSMAGITGMIVAIPVYTILRVFGKEFFNKFKVVQKLTEKI